MSTEQGATLPDVDASWKPETSKSDAADDDKPIPQPSVEEKDASEPDDADPPPESSSNGKPTQGEVLITEVMYDSSGAEPATEWIELYNTASSARSLSGLAIVDGGDRKQTVGSGVTIGAGAYVVLVRSKSAAIAAKVPSSAIVFEYGAGVADGSGVQLANGATGAVSLKDGSTTIAQSTYGGWFSQSGGSSVQLKTLSYSAGTQSSSWCLSKNTWASGSDKGTPGAASDCP